MVAGSQSAKRRAAGCLRQAAQSQDYSWHCDQMEAIQPVEWNKRDCTVARSERTASLRLSALRDQKVRIEKGVLPRSGAISSTSGKGGVQLTLLKVLSRMRYSPPHSTEGKGMDPPQPPSPEYKVYTSTLCAMDCVAAAHPQACCACRLMCRSDRHRQIMRRRRNRHLVPRCSDGAPTTRQPPR